MIPKSFKKLMSIAKGNVRLFRKGIKIRVLSMDGGAMLGIIPNLILSEIEDRIRTKVKDHDVKIGDYFDVIAGTSIGALSSMVYNIPNEDKTGSKYGAKDVVNLFEEEGEFILKRDYRRIILGLSGAFASKFTSDNICDVAARYAGEDAKLSDLVRPCLMVAFDICNNKVFFFSREEARKDPSKDFYLTDVVCATSAMPGLFPAHRFCSITGKVYVMIDGGVFSNSPSFWGYMEAERWLGQSSNKEDAENRLDDVFILSLGVGVENESNQFSYNQVKNWGWFQFGIPVFKMIFNHGIIKEDLFMRHLVREMRASKQYYRLSPQSKDPLSPLGDNPSKEAIKYWKDLTQRTIELYDKQIDEISDSLIVEQKRRKNISLDI